MSFSGNQRVAHTVFPVSTSGGVEEVDSCNILIYHLISIHNESNKLTLCCQVPQQENDYDCGLFVLYYMQRFIQEAPKRLQKKDLSMVSHDFITASHFICR